MVGLVDRDQGEGDGLQVCLHLWWRIKSRGREDWRLRLLILAGRLTEESRRKQGLLCLLDWRRKR